MGTILSEILSVWQLCTQVGHRVYLKVKVNFCLIGKKKKTTICWLQGTSRASVLVMRSYYQFNYYNWICSVMVFDDLWPTFSLISSALLHRGSASLYFPLFPYRTARLLRVAATWQGNKHIYYFKILFKPDDEPQSSSPVCVCVQPQDSTTAAQCHWSGVINEEEDVRKQEVIMVGCNLIPISCVMNLLHVHSGGARRSPLISDSDRLWWPCGQSGRKGGRKRGREGRGVRWLEEGEFIREDDRRSVTGREEGNKIEETEDRAKGESYCTYKTFFLTFSRTLFLNLIVLFSLIYVDAHFSIRNPSKKMTKTVLRSLK